jgi:hypothetical protein
VTLPVTSGSCESESTDAMLLIREKRRRLQNRGKMALYEGTEAMVKESRCNRRKRAVKHAARQVIMQEHVSGEEYNE